MKKIGILILLVVIVLLALVSTLIKASQESKALENQIAILEAQVNEPQVVLVDLEEINQLKNRISAIENESLEYKKDINKLLRNSLTPPYTTIEASQLVTAFTRTDGTPYTIQTPVGLLIADLSKKESGYTFLKATLGGRAETVVDMAPFVNPEPFVAAMTAFAELFPDDEQLIEEIWYMVTQFNTYLPEIGENPQTPLETLFLATGDCEDSSILIASLLKAVPRDWQISFVYTDYNNPTNPSVINHILVSVDTGEATYFIEGTNSQMMNPHGAVQGYFVPL